MNKKELVNILNEILNLKISLEKEIETAKTPFLDEVDFDGTRKVGYASQHGHPEIWKYPKQPTKEYPKLVVHEPKEFLKDMPRKTFIAPMIVSFVLFGIACIIALASVAFGVKLVGLIVAGVFLLIGLILILISTIKKSKYKREVVHAKERAQNLADEANKKEQEKYRVVKQEIDEKYAPLYEKYVSEKELFDEYTLFIKNQNKKVQQLYTQYERFVETSLAETDFKKSIPGFVFEEMRFLKELIHKLLSNNEVDSFEKSINEVVEMKQKEEEEQAELLRVKRAAEKAKFEKQARDIEEYDRKRREISEEINRSAQIRNMCGDCAHRFGCGLKNNLTTPVCGGFTPMPKGFKN